MKIGLMHNLYGEFSRGGAETAVKLMAEDFIKMGHEVFIITTAPKSSSVKRDDKQYLNSHAKVNNAPKIYYINSEFYNLNQHSLPYRAVWQLGNIFSFISACKIKKILLSEKPDLVITNNVMGLGYLTPLILRKLNIRHEHFLHDIQLLHPSGLMIFGGEKKISAIPAKAYQALTRALFASPAKVISPSVWLLEIHKLHGFFKDSESEVRPFIWPQTATIRTKTVPIRRFLFIGQIEKQKGIFLLIKAFKKITEPDLTLTVAIRGGGSDLAAAKELAKDDARIRLLGPLSYEETEKIKAASDCLIVPSLCYENSPTVIYGAHAAGLPVIASRLGGIPELMDKGDLLFTPGDEKDLIEKVLTKYY